MWFAEFLASRGGLALGLSLVLHALLLFGLQQLPGGGSAVVAEEAPGLFMVVDEGEVEPQEPHVFVPVAAPEQGSQTALVLPVTPISQEPIDAAMVNFQDWPGGNGSRAPAGAGSQGPTPAPGSKDGISFFGLSARGRRIVYVIDRSASMGQHGALLAAGRELIASIEAMPADSYFQVLVYHRQVEPILRNTSVWLSPSPEVKRKVADAMQSLRAEGSTDHMPALRRAVGMQPDAIFFLTDADDLTPDQQREITRLNRGQAMIHTIELTQAQRDRPEMPMQVLAREWRKVPRGEFAAVDQRAAACPRRPPAGQTRRLVNHLRLDLVLAPLYKNNRRSTCTLVCTGLTSTGALSMTESWITAPRTLGGLLLATCLALPLGFAVGQGTNSFNEREVKSEPSALDDPKLNVWAFDFRFKDPRLIKVNIPGRGTRICWYLWYQVVNRTKLPQTFYPKFELVTTDFPAVYEDELFPSVEDAIKKLEDPTGYQDIKNAVTISKNPIPVSQPATEAFPRVVTGVAIWDGTSADPNRKDPKAKDLSDSNRFTIFVGGLSNGLVEVDPLGSGKGEKPIVRYKTLQLNFKRLGDRFQMENREISFVPPAEWIYRAALLPVPDVGKGKEKAGAAPQLQLNPKR